MEVEKGLAAEGLVGYARGIDMSGGVRWIASVHEERQRHQGD